MLFLILKEGSERNALIEGMEGRSSGGVKVRQKDITWPSLGLSNEWVVGEEMKLCTQSDESLTVLRIVRTSMSLRR